MNFNTAASPQKLISVLWMRTQGTIIIASSYPNINNFRYPKISYVLSILQDNCSSSERKIYAS